VRVSLVARPDPQTLAAVAARFSAQPPLRAPRTGWGQERGAFGARHRASRRGYSRGRYVPAGGNAAGRSRPLLLLAGAAPPPAAPRAGNGEARRDEPEAAAGKTPRDERRHMRRKGYIRKRIAQLRETENEGKVTPPPSVASRIKINGRSATRHCIPVPRTRPGSLRWRASDTNTEASTGPRACCTGHPPHGLG